MSEEIEKAAPGELAPLSAEEQALADAMKGDIGQDRMVLPNVKLTQALTKEVVDDEVSAGHFFNSLTKQDYGDSIELVICGRFVGRFYSDEDNRAFAAQGDIAPENWPEEYRGKYFTEIPDAEEQFREAVNAGEREWGSGAPISTTYNYVGLIVGDTTPLPVRVSMMRGNSKVAGKIDTLLKFSRAAWDSTFTLSARKAVSAKGQPFYALEVGQGGAPSPEMRQAAVQVATEFNTAQSTGAVELAGDEDEPKAKSKPKGKSSGLGMS